MIERYFDGELSEPSAGLVAGHVAICASCASAYRRLEREQAFYLRHDCDVEASPAFWSGVFAKVAQDQASRPAGKFRSLWERSLEGFGRISAVRFGPLSTAVIVLLTVAVTAGVMKYMYSRDRGSERASGHQAPLVNDTPAIPPVRTGDLAGSNGDRRAVNPGSAGNRAQRGAGGSTVRRHDLKAVVARRRLTPEELLREAEQKYLAAIALLSRDANRRRSQFDSESLAQFDQTLATVDRAIAGARRVARVRPDDPVAVQYMLAAYAKKVDVLRQMVSDLR